MNNIKNILFICQGNIGRSQIAEAFVNFMFSDRFVAYSAGVDDVGHKYNYKPYAPVMHIMKHRYAIDMSNQQVKQIAALDISSFDCVVLLCTQEQCSTKIPRDIFDHKGLLVHVIKDPNKKSSGEMLAIIQDIYLLVRKICSD